MDNAATDVYDRAIDRAAMIRLYERRVTGKVNLVLDGHVVRLDTLVREAGQSAAGLQRLKEAVDIELRKTYREINSVTSKDMISLLKDQVSFQWQSMDAAVGRIWRTRRPAISQNFVLEQPLVGNKTLEEGWQNVGMTERRRIEQTIRRGIAERKTMEQIAVSVRRGNIHRITRSQSEALVITATTAVSTEADHAVYQANEKALNGWQYVAVLDSKTTPICSHRDGTIYPVGDTVHRPPAHYRCRSTTVPVFKSWEQMGELEGVAEVRRRNLNGLSKAQQRYYDGLTPLRESYNQWLSRQSQSTQLRHLGDYKKVALLNEGKLTVDRFVNDQGNSIGIRELRAMTYDTPATDSRRFALAKDQLDAMQLNALSADDLVDSDQLFRTLTDYYVLQSRDLDGNLSLTNYRGQLLHTKKANKQRVINVLPREDQMRFNPQTGRYEDTRLYQPNTSVLQNALRLVDESPDLKDKDKAFIRRVSDNLELRMSVNERSVIIDNLRIILGRQRTNGDPWVNLKGVIQAQLRYDVMNISDSLETQLRANANPFRKLLENNYIDPVLGPVQLDDLHRNFFSTIRARNRWEDKVAPRIANELKPFFTTQIPLRIQARLDDRALHQFYLRFAHKLAFNDLPDRDHLAVSLGRDLYNLANLNGSRNQWYTLGINLLNSPRASKFYKIETFGVQKRRMKSRMSGRYFGPYYDSLAYSIRVVDPRIQEYSRLQRSVDLGLRVSVTDPSNRLIIRPGYKTYFMDRGILGYEDTRIPITSTNSFSDFPDGFIDREFASALNWAGRAEYRIDPDFYNFTQRLLYFEDDRGNAKLFNDLNHYRKYLSSRGDTYERFKAMEWLSKNGLSFSNHPFIDHRARVYDRGLISPQSGEAFRPFLNSASAKPLGATGYRNLQDQIGAFLGGIDEVLEGKLNSLSFTGRQKIAQKWRSDMVAIGNAMQRCKPNDIRFILQHPMVARIDGEELGKFFRLSLEQSKLDNFLQGNYRDLTRLDRYRTAFAIEQDASSSGAQIIALTTKNKQLAQLSNVVPTAYKKRLYDEIAAKTFSDPRFKAINAELGLSEKDLRKAAKAQNMVTFYGAGERTGILNVEGKLAKILGKDTDTLVVTTADRDAVISQIDARIARVERYSVEDAEELRVLRANVRDIFNKGIDPGDEIMEELWFLDRATLEVVEKLSQNFERRVTPNDFKGIAMIMSEYLAEEVPILKEFTRFFGRVASSFLENAKPSSSNFDWRSIFKTTVLGTREKGYVLPDNVSRILGVKAGEPVSEKVLKRFGFWNPNGTLADIIYGVDSPEFRRTGAKYFKTEVLQVKTLTELEVFYANQLPKSWTQVPWVNFDGKTLEQVFTQVFEERLRYRNAEGEWITNILQVPQKTEATWWEQVINKDGKINDIANATRARTAYAVNGNHSNDAVLVKRFHLWGRDNNVPTSTIHDAFFTNIADMAPARKALRGIYADMVNTNSVEATLKEMRARGLPKELYDAFVQEAIELGIIPVVGVSRVGGRLLKEDDILTRKDILETIDETFENDYGWYGVG